MKLTECNRCELCKTRRKVVPGRGSGASGIFLIGEAPGRHEDKSGLPFVGDAGNLLNYTIPLFWTKSIGDFYITNIVKCWPIDVETKKGRPPNTQEIKMCGPWLDLELKNMKPFLIITLGNAALRRIDKEGGIGTKHGQVAYIEEHDAFIYPLYHPAAVLRDPDRLADIQHDDAIRLGSMLHRSWWEVQNWLMKSVKRR